MGYSYTPRSKPIWASAPLWWFIGIVALICILGFVSFNIGRNRDVYVVNGLDTKLVVEIDGGSPITIEPRKSDSPQSHKSTQAIVKLSEGKLSLIHI